VADPCCRLVRPWPTAGAWLVALPAVGGSGCHWLAGRVLGNGSVTIWLALAIPVMGMTGIRWRGSRAVPAGGRCCPALPVLIRVLAVSRLSHQPAE
jgi:hypothetical protein